MAAGVPSGQVVLLDPRTGFAHQASMAAHAGGLACMDARSDLVATCGHSTRQGHVVPDIYLKVCFCSIQNPANHFDARSNLVATCGHSNCHGHVVPDIYLRSASV